MERRTRESGEVVQLRAECGTLIYGSGVINQGEADVLRGLAISTSWIVSTQISEFWLHKREGENYSER